MGDIRKLRAISGDVRRHEEYQQWLRDKEREKRLKQKRLRELEEERKKAL